MLAWKKKLATTTAAAWFGFSFVAALSAQDSDGQSHRRMVAPVVRPFAADEQPVLGRPAASRQALLPQTSDAPAARSQAAVERVSKALPQSAVKDFAPQVASFDASETSPEAQSAFKAGANGTATIDTWVEPSVDDQTAVVAANFATGGMAGTAVGNYSTTNLPPLSPVPSVAAARLEQPPAISIRPTTLPADLNSECVVEMEKFQRPSGNEFALRLQIPDSVSMIELVPSVAAKRTFRIQMDRGAESSSGSIESTSSKSPSKLAYSSSAESAFPIPATQFTRQAETGGGELPSEIAPTESVATNKTQIARSMTARPGFQANPFFSGDQVARLQATAGQPAEASREVVVSLRSSALPPIVQAPIVQAETEYARESRLGVDLSNDLSTELNSDWVEEPTNTLGNVDEVAQRAVSTIVPTESSESREHLDSPPVTSVIFDPAPNQSLTATTADPIRQTEAANYRQLDLKLVGPERLSAGATAEFTAVVANNTYLDEKDVQVRLAFPAGVEILVLDREAWIDQASRTLVWQVPLVRAGQEIKIQYRVSVAQAGYVEQTLAVLSQSAAENSATPAAEMAIDAEAICGTDVFPRASFADQANGHHDNHDLR